MSPFVHNPLCHIQVTTETGLSNKSGRRKKLPMMMVANLGTIGWRMWWVLVLADFFFGVKLMHQLTFDY